MTQPDLQSVHLGGRTLSLVTVQLCGRARALAAQGGSEHTFRAYARQVAAFDRWCSTTEHDPWTDPPIVVAHYLASMSDRELSRATMQQALSALRAVYRVADRYDDAAWRHIGALMRGADKASAEHAPTRGCAVPLRLAELAAACRALLAQEHREHELSAKAGGPRDARHRAQIAARDRAMLLIGWFGGLRRSEIVHVRFADVTEQPEGLSVTIRTSKTSTTPETLSLPAGEQPETDPRRAWLAWRALQPRALIDDGAPAWTRIGRIDSIADGHQVGRTLRRALALAGVTGWQHYSAHSLRAGLATELAESGVSLPQIANAGRWSNRSLATVMGYARRARRWEDSPLRALRY